MGGGRDVTLYAITIDPRQPIRMSLSEEGERAASEAVRQILAEVGAESAVGKREANLQNQPELV